MGKKALLKDAAAAAGLTKHALYQLARAGEVPCIRIGGRRGRYLFDLELLEQRLKELAMSNLRHSDQQAGYGQLRRVQ